MPWGRHAGLLEGVFVESEKTGPGVYRARLLLIGAVPPDRRCPLHLRSEFMPVHHPGTHSPAATAQPAIICHNGYLRRILGPGKSLQNGVICRQWGAEADPHPARRGRAVGIISVEKDREMPASRRSALAQEPHEGTSRFSVTPSLGGRLSDQVVSVKPVRHD